MPQASFADIAPSVQDSSGSSDLVVIILIVVIVLAIAGLALWLVRRNRRPGGRRGPEDPPR